MSNRQLRAFKTKVFISLRTIVRLTQDGYEAECIDAGAVGLGETQDEALRELCSSLEELYLASGKDMRVAASKEDEKVFGLLAAHQQTGDPSIVSFCTLQRIQITAIGATPKIQKKAVFEVAELQQAA
jgi:hypothetical protein